MPPSSLDETEPLLGPDPDELNGHDNTPKNPDLTGDQEFPRNRSKAFKWAITTLLAFMAFTVTFNCISVVPIASRIVDDLSGPDQSSKSASVLLVTIWELGEAAGPLFLAPLSETFGRWPVINIANGCFVAATALAAVCQTTPLFIAARALSGLVVTANVLNPAVMGDIWEPESRGSPMSLMTLGPFIGGTAGPALSGLIAEKLDWRWVLWISVVLSGTCAALLFTSLPETYGPVILRRKNKRLHVAPENGIPEPPVGGKKGSYAELVESIARPGIVFASSGVLMAMSLFSSVAFAHYYNMATTLPAILEGMYGLSPALTGSAMLPFSIGSAISTFVCNAKLDSVYIKLRDANDGIGQPEFRLPLIILGALIQPVAYAAYGWIAHFQLPLPILFLNIGFMGVTLTLTMLPMYAYVVDAFGIYSASAMTGVIVSRCLMGTFLPLSSTPLIEHLGYGWGLTVPAALSLVLAPIPILVMKYGEKWRQRCPYSRTQ